MGSPLLVRAKRSQQQLQTRVCDQQNLLPNIKPPKKHLSSTTRWVLHNKVGAPPRQILLCLRLKSA